MPRKWGECTGVPPRREYLVTCGLKSGSDLRILPEGIITEMQKCNRDLGGRRLEKKSRRMPRVPEAKSDQISELEYILIGS